MIEKNAGHKTPHLNKDGFAIPLMSHENVFSPPGNLIYQLLSTGGDGSGTTNQREATPTTYRITCEAGYRYAIERLNIYVEDSVLHSSKYIGINALSVGITLSVYNQDNTLLKNLTPIPIKTLMQWDLIGNTDALELDAVQNDAVSIHIDFHQFNKLLWLTPGDYLLMSFGDDMSGLISHYTLIQGYKEQIQT